MTSWALLLPLADDDVRVGVDDAGRWAGVEEDELSVVEDQSRLMAESIGMLTASFSEGRGLGVGRRGRRGWRAGQDVHDFRADAFPTPTLDSLRPTVSAHFFAPCWCRLRTRVVCTRVGER